MDTPQTGVDPELGPVQRQTGNPLSCTRDFLHLGIGPVSAVYLAQKFYGPNLRPCKCTSLKYCFRAL